MRRPAAIIAGVVMSIGLAGSPAKADPAVTAIAIGGIASLVWGIYENPEQLDAEREFVSVGGGIFDIVDDEDRAGMASFEYWSPWTFYRFRPFGGMFVTTDGGIAGFIGLRHDVNFGRHLVFSPNMAVMAFSDGNGKDLGSSLVLRSGLELAYRFDSGARLSATFHHMSHGEVFGDENPGTETGTLTFTMPTDAVFGGQLFDSAHYWPQPFGW